MACRENYYSANCRVLDADHVLVQGEVFVRESTVKAKDEDKDEDKDKDGKPNT